MIYLIYHGSNIYKASWDIISCKLGVCRILGFSFSLYYTTFFILPSQNFFWCWVFILWFFEDILDKSSAKKDLQSFWVNFMVCFPRITKSFSMPITNFSLPDVRCAESQSLIDCYSHDRPPRATWILTVFSKRLRSYFTLVYFLILYRR